MAIELKPDIEKRNMEKVTVERCTVTPEFAKSILEMNYENNRHIDPFRVLKYVDEMKKGMWEDNGETIKIDEKDRLIDGQHRLRAVVESGVPIAATLVWGLPTKVFRTIDRGKSRSISDCLKFEHEANVQCLAAVLSLLWRWLNRAGGVPTVRRVGLTPVRAREILDRYPEIRESVQMAYQKRHALAGICTSSVAAFAHHLFRKTDNARANQFIAHLVTGASLEEQHPLLVAREQMRRMKARQVSYADYEYLGILILAWNAFKRGRTKVRPFEMNLARSFPNPM
jgi:hypothetical protein